MAAAEGVPERRGLMGGIDRSRSGAGGRASACCGKQGTMNRVQVPMPEFSVGFDVVSLGPFVPGLEEDDPFLGRLSLQEGDGLLQIITEERGRCLFEHDASMRGSRRVVPCRQNRRDI